MRIARWAAPAAVALLAACAGQQGGGSTGAPQVDVRDAGDAQAFVGRSGAQVTAQIGAPGFIRRDGEAEVWQYRGDLCVLDLFVYRDGGAQRVRHAELRGRNAAAPAGDACLDDALRNTRART